ncbi:sulfatase [Oleiharenicola lentus]|uniref:sulfatase n=1 Tax=Oleiharenicola lentus TaxID=2508720 RepID=UPI003F673CB5
MKKTILLLCLVWCVPCPAAELKAAAPARPPNVLIIMADDLGFADLGRQGSKDIVTPNIDAIAATGVTFTNAYVTAPVCMPSRMGMLTGRYQQRFGIQTLGNDNLGMPATELNLGQMLKARGYATGIVGKWHLGTNPEFRPNARGFDEFYGFLNGNISYYPGSGKFWRNAEPTEKPAYATDGFGDEAVSFINRHAAQPFFLYLAFNAPHSPMQAPPRYVERFAGIADEGRRIYAAMTSAMDDNIGRVLAALHEKGIAENTIIIFLSDNGGAPQNFSENAPLRAGKYEIYEGGIRTPFFVRWPAGGVPAGEKRTAPISALDIVPTILAATETTADPARPLDGMNLLPALRSEANVLPADRRLYWRYGPYMAAMREGDWKILKAGVGENKRPAWELYNLAQDASEKNDLASAHPEKVRRLSAVFEAWDQTLATPIFIDKRLIEGTIWWRKRAALDDPSG